MSESQAADAETGIRTKQLQDGTTLVTYYFETPGPLYRKTQKIEKIADGQTTTIFQASYNEAGRPIQEIDKRGFTTTYTYDASGGLLGKKTSMPTDPGRLALLKEKETSLLNLINHTTDPKDRSGVVERLAYFYVDSYLDVKKAEELIPQMSNPLDVCDIQSVIIDRSETLSEKQKAAKLKKLDSQYPTRHYHLSQLISVHEYAASLEQSQHNQ